jgi:hypothetical protein
MLNERQLRTLLAKPPESLKAREVALKSLNGDIEKALHDVSRLSGHDWKPSPLTQLATLVQSIWASTSADKKASVEQAIQSHAAILELQETALKLSNLRVKALKAAAAARKVSAGNKSMGSALGAVTAAYRKEGATMQEQFALSTHIAGLMKQIDSPGKSESVPPILGPAPWGEFTVRLNDPPDKKHKNETLARQKILLEQEVVLGPYSDILDKRLHPAMLEEGQKKRKAEKKM